MLRIETIAIGGEGIALGLLSLLEMSDNSGESLRNASKNIRQAKKGGAEERERETVKTNKEQ